MFNVDRLKISTKDKKLVDINFSVKKSLALVGQSGSGKSLTLKALLNLLESSLSVELNIQSDFELIRGKSLSFVPQNPFTALSPLTKIKKQFFVKESRVEELMRAVELDIALLERFPLELSGGQLQRVVIAIALSNTPELLLLDEPTTALDAPLREMIVKLLKSLQEQMKFKIIFVTHDMSSASALCDEICVIQNGEVKEYGEMRDVIMSPKSEYTAELISASFANREFRE
ncbi:MAG: ATP-binding cassette domain-containing protein [Helicobacteraceae bacterium]|nr:ATP-binding cassette domain-containing protein [Helicobacteraceae bacterium]